VSNSSRGLGIKNLVKVTYFRVLQCHVYAELVVNLYNVSMIVISVNFLVVTNPGQEIIWWSLPRTYLHVGSLSGAIYSSVHVPTPDASMPQVKS
jgi:hypothetical protein